MDLKFGLLNANSIASCKKANDVTKFIVNQGLDALAICETKLVRTDPKRVKRRVLRSTYEIVNRPRQHATRKNRGGRLAFIYKKSWAVTTHWRQSMLRAVALQCIGYSRSRFRYTVFEKVGTSV